MVFERRMRLWCIVKSAKLLDGPHGDELTSIPFGRTVTAPARPPMRDGMIKVAYYDPAADVFTSSVFTVGWVNMRAFTDVPAEDYAKLYFVNKMGKRLPASMRYQGRQEQWILPGEKVAMVARVGDWCLTSRGWSKFEWFRKCRDGDPEDFMELAFAVLKQAAYDLRSATDKLKKKKYRGYDAFLRLVWKVEEIENWFGSHEFTLLYGELDGKARLRDLKDDLKITKEWWKGIKRQAKDLEAKGWGKKI